MDWKTLIKFLGPGYMIAIGYLDPGNWATDLAAGSQFGYKLLFVVLLANIMAVTLQYLCVKLGVITQMDLAEACRAHFSPKINIILYILCEIAIISCDLAEVLGSAIALQMIFGLPLSIGIVITCLDVFLILLAWNAKHIRLFEYLIGILFFIILSCFIILLYSIYPPFFDVVQGFIPSYTVVSNPKALYIAIGIVGATVMPHNLYLHSNIVKNRSHRSINELGEIYIPTSDDSESFMHSATINRFCHSILKRTINLTALDSIFALFLALAVNASILIVSSAAFYDAPVTLNDNDLIQAFNLLIVKFGYVCGYLFAFALLLSGQSSTITGTMAGQICMEGFLGSQYLPSPALRRMLTRGIAIVPALFVSLYYGEKGVNDLLVFSQVFLSLQLPFAMWPLIYFTSCTRIMSLESIEDLESGFEENVDQDPEISGQTRLLENENTGIVVQDYSNSWLLSIAASLFAFIITAFNLILVGEILYEYMA